MTDSLAPFISAATSALHTAVEQAYERGLSDGYAKAQDELRQRVALALDYTGVNITPPDHLSKNEPQKESERKSPWSGPRAPRGSVRPAILGVLRRSTGPMKASEIHRALIDAGHTLIKDETIRSTLHKMGAMDDVEKIGEGWVAVDMIDDTLPEPETIKGVLE